MWDKLDKIKDFFMAIIKSRIFVLGAVFFVMFSIIVIRLFNLQIVNQASYLENYIQKSQKTIYTPGTRGIIYDRNGEVLAYNKLAYAVTIEDTIESGSKKNETLNSIIDKTIAIIEKNSDSLVNDFAILQNSDGSYGYSIDPEKSISAYSQFMVNVYGKTVDELKKNGDYYNTAEKTMQFLCSSDKFDISDNYDTTQRLKIAMIRYNLSLNTYQKYIATTIASNVSDATVAAIYENEQEISGVTVAETSVREYDQGVYFAHILGYTGEISETQLAEKNSSSNDKEYISGDVVGKSGIEEKMDSYLQGTRGEETVFVDSLGKILETTDETEPLAGNNLYLTIDKNLQIAAYNLLEQKLAGILYRKIVNSQVTVSEDDKVKNISIYQVYYQMINNNVVDITKFTLDTASENEKNVYNKFSSKYETVISDINQNLTDSDSQPMASLSDETKEYMNYIYDKLSSSEVGILDESTLDEDDDTYKAWQNESISLREFLTYAIAKNWIDTSKINDSEDSEKKYASSNEVYNDLVDYIIKNLNGDTDFYKKIYYYLIYYNQSLTGSEVCLLLYDQGVLPYDESKVNQLKNGNSATAYNFMMEQIYYMNITPAQVALDPCSGSCVVTDTDTGDVLALVTYPSYDNNKLSGTVDSTYWKQLNDDLSLPLYNRATQTRTAPGSTFKMVTAITGMQEGKINPSTTIQDKAEFTLAGMPYPKCWKYPSNHGTVNTSSALEVSCNYFFYQVGYWLSLENDGTYSSQLGLDRMQKYAQLLGLDEISGIELDENDPNYSTENSVRSAIGQGSHAYANIQLARYVNTIANSGKNYSLTLLNKIVDSSGNVIKEYEPNLESTMDDVSQATWDAVHQGMRQVVAGSSGTARTVFSDFPIEVSGKSGTAEENKLRSSHTLFVAYAPSSNPEISLSVSIPYGESSGYSGELVRDVVAYYYKQILIEDVLNRNASVPSSGITSD